LKFISFVQNNLVNYLVIFLTTAFLNAKILIITHKETFARDHKQVKKAKISLLFVLKLVNS